MSNSLRLLLHITLFLPLITLALSTAAQTTMASEEPVRTITDQQARTFLMRATFGPTPADVSALQTLGYEGWIDAQLAMPVSQSILNRSVAIAMQAEPTTNWFGPQGLLPPKNSPFWAYFNAAWWEQSLTAPDQLRQRVAFALSEIFVVSFSATPYLRRRAEAIAAWADVLQQHAFGDFRQLMTAASTSPAMGVFLTHHGNRKANVKKGTAPDENYARELMQLFVLGLYQTDMQGQPKYDDKGRPLATYTQDDVMNLARVFTGWDMQGNDRYGQRSQEGGNLTVPMEFTNKFHDTGEKTLLDVTIPAGLSGPEDLAAALDILFAQPEVAPHVSRLLIQRLVTSNPSPTYIGRVAQVFNGKGKQGSATNKRGDLSAVVKAILLDPEALATEALQSSNSGSVGGSKIKEPILMLSQFLRAMQAKPSPAATTPKGGNLEGIYWIKALELGQAPLQADSVFNFFDDDFQPPELMTGQLAPELQILDSAALIGFSNLLNFLLYQREHVALEGMSVTQHHKLNDRRFSSSMSIQLDLRPDIALLREQGPEALFVALEQRLMACPASNATKTAVLNTLREAHTRKRDIIARHRIADAIRLMASAPEQWVQ